MSTKIAQIRSPIRTVLDKYGYEKVEDIFVNNDCVVFKEVMDLYSTNSNIPGLMIAFIFEHHAIELLVIYCRYMIDIGTITSILRGLLLRFDDYDDDTDFYGYVTMFTMLFNTHKTRLDDSSKLFIVNYIFSMDEPGMSQLRRMIMLDRDYVDSVARSRPCILLYGEYTEDDLSCVIETRISLCMKYYILNEYAGVYPYERMTSLAYKLDTLYIKENIDKLMCMYYYVMSPLDKDCKVIICRLLIRSDTRDMIALTGPINVNPRSLLGI